MAIEFLSQSDLTSLKNEIDSLFNRLYPLCRSILGQGYRDSLDILREYVPFELEYFKSGVQVLNWKIPKEWIIEEAYIENDNHEKIIDFKNNNLHVVNYSSPIDAVLPLESLKAHIYTSSTSDIAIPYTLSYYKERWGFCMSKKQLDSLPDGNYHVCIQSKFVDGALVTGQTVLEGESKKEILLSSYLCHPSMANNELSGPLVLAMLYHRIKNWKNRKYTYRFVINPETIGSIAYLSAHGDELKNSLHAGLVLTCLGGKVDSLRIKHSRLGTAPFDRLVRRINSFNLDNYNTSEQSAAFSEFYKSIEITGKFRTIDFLPNEGSDERQYCSAGFNLPVRQISRLSYGTYKEYHTSLDNKELMGIDTIIDSANRIEALLKLEEKEVYYENLYPYGEVKLGDYDLYPSVNSSGAKSSENELLINDPDFVRKVMYILSFSDGKTPLSEIAVKLNSNEHQLEIVSKILVEKGLLKEAL